MADRLFAQVGLEDLADRGLGHLGQDDALLTAGDPQIVILVEETQIARAQLGLTVLHHIEPQIAPVVGISLTVNDARA
jgi:hypothetical protein